MSKEREPIKQRFKTFKIALLEGDVELTKLMLDSENYLRSRKGAVTAGALSGAAVAIGEWKAGVALAALAISYKGLSQIRNNYKKWLKEWIEMDEKKLEELKTDLKEKED